jgi:tRNA A37 threonylcarbamoyladenosine dehydratase
MLLRAGVGHLRLIDFDQVTLSSLNRHATATRADVGLPKAAALAASFRAILPEARVDARVAMFSAANAEELLAGPVAYVVDAIDNIGTKVDLLRACAARGLRVVCAAGAGAKADPTRVRLVDLAATARDPLARAVRYKLRAAGGDPGGVVAVVSDEAPRCALVWAGGEGGGGGAPGEASAAAAAAADPEAFRPAPGFRVRTVPVLGPTPAAFGLAAAALVLCDLAGAPFHPCPPPDPRGAPTYRVLLDRLAEADGEEPALDLDDVTALVRSVWRCASAWDGLMGGGGLPARLPGGGGGKARGRGAPSDLASLTFIRWDPALPSRPDNLVLLSFGEAEALGEGGGGVALEARVTAGTATPEEVAFVGRVRGCLAAAGVECGTRGWE